MRNLLIISAVLVLALSATGASAAEYDAELNAGESTTIEGAIAAGINQNYFGLTGVGPADTCSDDPTAYCDTVLLTLNNPVEDDGDPETNRSDRQNLDLLLTPQHAGMDLDMIVRASDADGTRGANIGQSGLTPVADCETSCEELFMQVTTYEDEPTVYLLVEVVYFAAAGGWTLDADF